MSRTPERVPRDSWAAADAYETYMGRWSRAVAREFIGWLRVPDGRTWVDVGCGTGALSQTILTDGSPRAVFSLDRSFPFAASLRAPHPAVTGVVVGDGAALPLAAECADAAVSGLVLNFLPEPAAMVAEMRRVARRGGTVAVYVWDYADGMQPLRYFWDAATELDEGARALDEGVRFPICRREPLRALFEDGGLEDVTVTALDVPAVFRSFEDYWDPFLGGQGPAPGYVNQLSNERKTELRDALRARMPADPAGRIPLSARAWAARGMRA